MDLFTFDVLTRFYSQFSSICFVECATADDADKLVKTMNGYPFDAEHNFALNHWDDFFLQDTLPPTFVAPQVDDSSDSQVCYILFYHFGRECS